MEAKKSKKADLKSKQVLFLEVGLVVALSLVFAAFQWSTPNQREMILSGGMVIDYDQQLIPITRMEAPKPKEVAPPKKALQLVIIEGPVEFDDPNFDFNSEVDEYIYVEPIFLEPEPEEFHRDTFVLVEDMPVFPGGKKALLRFIASETNYPELAKRNGVQGKVYVGFLVDKKGFVQEVKIARSADATLDKEAIRVVSSMPQWKPGMQRGKPVNVCFTVPINFKLQ